MYSKRQSGKGIRVLWLLLLVPLLATGCQKTRFELVLGETSTLDQARLFFGKPDVTEPLPDGSTRCIWKIDRMEQIPGQWVEQVVDILYDRSGFPVPIVHRYFSPAHLERRDCILVMEADATGKIIRSSWAGNDCGGLLYPDRQDYETLQPGRSLDSLEEGEGPEGYPWF